MVVFIVVVLLFMLMMGKALEEDLESLEETDPKHRKYLKDRFNI